MLEYRLRCFSSDKLVFWAETRWYFWSKSHSWKAVAVVHYVYLFAAFSPHIRAFLQSSQGQWKGKVLRAKKIWRRDKTGSMLLVRFYLLYSAAFTFNAWSNFCRWSLQTISRGEKMLVYLTFILSGPENPKLLPKQHKGSVTQTQHAISATSNRLAFWILSEHFCHKNSDSVVRCLSA